jgi:hypothetical protein
MIVDLAREGTVVSGRLFFGFLTGSGMDALLAVPEVSTVFRTASLDILVGLDAVTDRAGLLRLQAAATENPHLQVRVIKNRTGVLIHPKMLLFQYDNGAGAIVVGSNNLSGNGLSGNVEGYSVYWYAAGEEPDLADWNEFVSRWSPLLSSIDNDALERALRNERRIQRIRRAMQPRGHKTPAEPEVIVTDGELVESAPVEMQVQEIMLALQLPKSDRWSQVQISKPISREFFHFDPGVDQPPVLLLREYGQAEGEPARPMLYLPKSDTVRFEVAAARRAGPYPTNGRPIALIRRESAEEARYRYVFLMTGDPGHQEIADLTQQQFHGRGLPRVVLPRNLVVAAWPDCPL